MKLIDAHVHFWNPHHLTYRWIEGNATLSRAYLPADYAAAVSEHTVDGIIFVEAGCAGKENLREVEWVETLDAPLKGIVAHAALENETWRAPDRAGLSMIVGNAGGLEVSVDGVTLPPLGEENRVRRDVPLDPDALLAAAAPPAAAETEAPPDAAPEAPPETGAGPETAPEDAPEAPREAASAADDARGRVVLRAVRDSWVRVAGPDNRTVLSRVLRAGETWRAPDRAGLSMVVGNAGGLEVVVDGVTLPPLGEENRTRRDVPLDVEALLAFAR